MDVPEEADGKSLRELHDTLRNRMRSLESLGLKPDDNPSLSMVLLPIFDTKLPRELKEKWELELTKYETDEEDKEINIKKLFQFLEGHVLSTEAPDDTKIVYQNTKREMVETENPRIRMTKRICQLNPYLVPLITEI